MCSKHALAATIAVCLAVGTLEHPRASAAAQATAWQRQTLRNLQKRSLYLEHVMHSRAAALPAPVESKLASGSTPRERARVLIKTWQGVYRRIETAYRKPPLLAELSCIHRAEGSWDDTRNPSYDGGLQMDLSFQARYGGFLLRQKGRAYRWTPLEQIWTAVYAIRGPDHRGFYPWPLTARACGLI